jgi:hypothetical protein
MKKPVHTAVKNSLFMGIRTGNTAATTAIYTIGFGEKKKEENHIKVEETNERNEMGINRNRKIKTCPIQSQKKIKSR